MENSHLARLPKELRLIIYEYALSADFTISIRPYMSWSADRRYSTAKLEIEPYPDADDSFDAGSDEDSDIESEPGASGDDDESSGTDSDYHICPRLASDSDDDSEAEPLTRPSPMALTYTCRQIRTEALPIFYAINRISISDNDDLYTRYPALQTLLLSRWLRHIPDSQLGLSFRAITISIRCAWEHPTRSSPPHDVAQEIYERYVEIASCFNTSRTRLSLDLGDMWEPSHAPGLLGTVAWTPARNLFVMTPWTGLREQVETHVSQTEKGFQRAKGSRIAQSPRRPDPERQREHVANLEGYARNSREVLRRLVELVERDERRGE